MSNIVDLIKGKVNLRFLIVSSDDSSLRDKDFICSFRSSRAAEVSDSLFVKKTLSFSAEEAEQC